MSDTVRAPKCPYLSSMGFYEIHCQLHCLRIVDKGFENPKLLQQHTEEYCFLDFDKCETYKQIHKKEMESTDSLILGYRECAFCCNNSGYTGLNGQNGSTHGFCQVRQEAVPKFDTGSVCEWFNRLKREEVREVAKQTYYTKCGRQFEKNSTAVVTGYDIDINDPECADCPFQVDVKEGWPQVHKKWECRAGSQPPNHTTEWTGSLENKNTMSIHSLDNNFMEAVIEFCENHPNLGASYNADHMADCRRTLAINCSSNKKGIASKRELVEKFFPTEEQKEEREEMNSNQLCRFFNTTMKCESKPEAAKWCIKADEKACKYFPENLAKEAEETALEAATSKDVTSFDYTTVDEETSAFLQEKAQKITEIRIKSVIALGKELKEAQDRLASHNKYDGVFTKWIESAGLKKSTAYNYIQAYDYVVQNLDNIEDANNIQPSLLFAASKPSAPAELQQGVLSGDITTHKQYKELEQKLKDAKEAAERARQLKFQADTDKIKAEMALKKAEEESKRSINALNKTVHDLQQQREQAQRNSDPSKVQELGQRIAGYQQEINDYQSQIGSLNVQLAETKQQLHDKPIEVAATEVVEKEIIPDEVAEAIYDKVVKLYEGIVKLTDKEIQIFANQVNPDYYDDISDVIDDAQTRLENIRSAAYDATTNASEPIGHCGDCINADMDQVTEEQLDEGKTLCTVTNQVVDFMHSCDQHKSFRGE